MDKIRLLVPLNVLLITVIVQVCDGGPPRVENKPILLNSYIPAAMQVIAHLTDLMKYDLRPQKVPSTTTTLRPTPSHKPGLYAPDRPLSLQHYLNDKNLLLNDAAATRRDYFTRYKSNDLNNDDNGVNYKDVEDNLNLRDVKDLEFLGKDYETFIKYVNKIEQDFSDGRDVKDVDDDVSVKNLLNGLDDSNFGLELLRQKRVPPTRAYVTLLSLYDQLNKESKKLNLNKYGGYSDSVLKTLISTSYGTSAEQLQTVLSKIVERRDTSNESILKKVNPLLIDLSQSDSYIHDALRFIPPLQFID